MAQLNFDASHVKPAEAPEAVPAGWYVVAISESDMKPTKDAQTTGHAYLELKEKILEGPHAGQVIFDRLNLQHSNPVTVEIAYRQLSAYCHATGVIQVADSSQLHGIPFRVRVSYKPAEGEYNASNDVKAVKHISEQVPNAQPASAGLPGTSSPSAPPPVQAPAQPAWQPPAQAAPAPAAPQQAWQPPAQTAPPAQPAGQPAPPWAQQNAAATAPAQPASPGAAAPAQAAPAGPPGAAGSTPPPWAR